MKLLLAYGNSDQASFRDPDVQSALDYLVVPGTIAAYYPDATAAFVLSSELNYVIDPRTPLFQGRIDAPRASHFTLAEWLGPSVRSHMGEPGNGLVAFDSSTYTPDVVREVVENLIGQQRRYAQRAATVASRFDRYRQMLLQARGEESVSLSFTTSSPSFQLAPYFASQSLSDPWWAVNESIWQSCLELDDPEAISAVVAVTATDHLQNAFEQVPAGLSKAVFYWVTGFDERRATESQLMAVAESVRQTSETRSLVNLYGGFFSLCLAYAGLWGVSSGMAYSESRAWPELATTGAAPARYYVPRLHTFLAPAAAQLLVEADDWFACQCVVCEAGGIAALQYGDLKRHFVNSRRWEIELVSGTPPAGVAASLDEAANRLHNLGPELPPRLVPDTPFLGAWARVLSTL